MAIQTVGPSLLVGGNTVQMTTRGKVQVTNPQGKVQTLSQDEFKKQVIKNADKIQNGEDFEFKSNKGKKALKIGAAIAGTAAVVAGVIYRKDIAKYIKNFTWKGFKQDLKNLGKKILNFGKKVKDKVVGFFSKKKSERTIFDGEKAVQLGREGARTARETLALKNQAIVERTARYVDDFEKSLANTKNIVHTNKQKMYEKMFDKLAFTRG